MVIASSEYEPSLTIAPWTVPCARRRASGRRPSSLMMITWRASGADRGSAAASPAPPRRVLLHGSAGPIAGPASSASHEVRRRRYISGAGAARGAGRGTRRGAARSAGTLVARGTAGGTSERALADCRQPDATAAAMVATAIAPIVDHRRRTTWEFTTSRRADACGRARRFVVFRAIRTSVARGGSCAALWLWALAVTACAHVEPTNCASDKDCKQARVCEHGHCAWPSPP